MTHRHGRDWSYSKGLLNSAAGKPGFQAALWGNAAVLAFVSFSSADIYFLMKVYWWELVIVWLFSMLKTFRASPLYAAVYFPPSALGTCVYLLIFMTLAARIGQVQAPSWKDFLQPLLITAVAPLLVSHASSFLRDPRLEPASVAEGGERARAKELAFSARDRVTIWTIVFMTCCYVAEKAGIGRFAYVLIIGCKTIAEIYTLPTTAETRPPENSGKDRGDITSALRSFSRDRPD